MEKAYETPHGTKRAAAVSAVVAAVLAITTFPTEAGIADFGLQAVLFGLGWMLFPGVLRALICSDWRGAEATVLSSQDVSTVTVNEQGGAGVNYWYKASLQYTADGMEYIGTASDQTPYGIKKNIYYNPDNPSLFTQYRSMGFRGGAFLVLLCIATWLRLHG